MAIPFYLMVPTHLTEEMNDRAMSTGRQETVSRGCE